MVPALLHERAAGAHHFALPAIAGVAGNGSLDTKQDGKAAENRRAYWLIGSMTVGTVLGILLGS